MIYFDFQLAEEKVDLNLKNVLLLNFIISSDQILPM